MTWPPPDPGVPAGPLEDAAGPARPRKTCWRSRRGRSLVVFVLFAASAAGQITTVGVRAHRALPVGCVVLTGGMMVIAASMLSGSLVLLLAGAVITGIGQGMGFSAAVTMVNEHSEPRRRGEITSGLFVVLYIAISLPVVGIGVLAQSVGLRTAEVVFAAFVAVLALIAAVLVTPGPLQWTRCRNGDVREDDRRDADRPNRRPR